MRKKLATILASVMISSAFAASASAAVSYETEVIAGVNFRTGPSTGSSVIRLIPRGEDIHVIEKMNSYWLKIEDQRGKIGYISANAKYTDFKAATTGGGTSPTAPSGESTSPAVSTSTLRNNIVTVAKSYNGQFDYKFGAEPWTTNNRYTDCSAFVKLVYREVGIELKRSSRDQSKQGTYVSKSNLKLGDLIFFDTNNDNVINHVGIYIGDGNFIHANPAWDGVGMNNFNSGFWSKAYVTARNIVG
ncbi:C40 family peptidase [Paenibacillus thermotolerans]|uniref:C40 family peptidase n=1 Tax=Paenibacillus thermotolerans TaxID=3027807 RepID=UPI002367BE80|nr:MULTISPECIES: NlpC/P60 family protein [unclassified Paenibacillus]